jgi:hypothetical protein
LDTKSFRLSWSKTKYMKCDLLHYHVGGGDVRLDGQVVSKKDTFHYLRSMFQEDENIDKDISHRINVGLLK